MKRLGAGIVVALAVMALTAVIAANAGTTQASEEQQAAELERQARLGVDRGTGSFGGETDLKRSAAPEEKMAWIGIGVRELPDAEAEELGIAGGAVVGQVLVDGPSAGLLAQGDVITSVGGTDVSSPADVVDAVKTVEPGDVLSFTVVRDGETLTVEVEVGERPHRSSREGSERKRGAPGSVHGNRMFGLLRQLGDKLAKAEIVLETPDGFMNIRAVAGLLSDIDVENGTFTLTPVDGSDPIPYEISEGTAVTTKHEGTLEGLTTTDRTFVVDVDGEVKLVHQGNLNLSRHRPGGILRGFERDSSGRGFGSFEMPRIQERLQGIFPDLTLEDIQGGNFDVRAFIEGHRGALGEGSESLQDALSDIIGSAGEDTTQ